MIKKLTRHGNSLALVIDKGVLRADCSLEEFRLAVKKVRFSFPQAVPEKIEIPGLLHKRQSGSLVNDFSKLP